jgi:ATPase family associated with various cellular activities (AAA)
MPDPATTVDGGIKQSAAYTSSWEHLSAELQRLDLLIRLQLLRHRCRQPSSPLDQFRGLVVTETEVASLLAPAGIADEGDAIAQSRAEEDSLLAVLTAIEKEIAERRALSQQEGIYLSLAHLVALFQLTPFQQNVLLLALAPQLDRKYEKLYAYLQDDVTRKAPTVDLAMTLFLSTPDQRLRARGAFDPGAALLRFNLLQIPENEAETTPLLSRQIKLDDRMVNFFLDRDRVEARLDRAVRVLQPKEDSASRGLADRDQQCVRAFIQSDFAGTTDENLVVYCRGACRAEKEAFAEAIAADLKQRVVIADLAQLIEGLLPFDDALWLIGREALLQPAVLCFENFDSVNAEDLNSQTRLKLVFDAAKACCRHVFLFGRRSWHPRGLLNQSIFVDLYFPTPDDGDRKQLWESIAAGQFADDVNFGAVASKFHFTRGQIEDASIAAGDLARLRPDGDGKIRTTDLEAACRAQSSQKLATLARHVKPSYTWDDIVLPEGVLAQLRELCQCVSHRYRVLGEWGFGRRLSLGKGVNALFAGPSGTGKTMGTEIIANELGMDLYKIDLSGVISKYIGETEKNLDRIFSAAEETSAILFFDEADALFGKRSEVRDSHDRHANIEISYLLQKMEEYEGLAILATNLRQNMDDAFLRRLQFVVEFPFPDEDHRRRIWQVLFPAEAPRDEIEFGFLASQFRFAGGNIKNIVLGAAYLAAADGGRITMNHLMRATSRECQKIGRVLKHEELESFQR